MNVRIAVLIVSCLALRAEACSCVSWVKVPFDQEKDEQLHGPIEPADSFLFRNGDVIAVGTVVESSTTILRVDVREVLKGDLPVGEATFKPDRSNCALRPPKGSEFLIVTNRDLVVHQCNGGGSLGPEDNEWTKVHRRRLAVFREHAR